MSKREKYLTPKEKIELEKKQKRNERISRGDKLIFEKWNDSQNLIRIVIESNRGTRQICCPS